MRSQAEEAFGECGGEVVHTCTWRGEGGKEMVLICMSCMYLPGGKGSDKACKQWKFCISHLRQSDVPLNYFDIKA